jgi:diguanylate cyclase (GGDEF)-like protein
MWVFKKTASFLVAGNLFSFFMAMMIACSAWYSGGFPGSPILQLLLIVPIYSFFMSGSFSSYFWMLAVTLIAFVFYGLSNRGYIFPSNIPDQHLESVRLIFTLLLGFFTLVGLGIYQMVNRFLEYRLSSERMRFEYEAAHDPLTRLANRATFNRRISESIERSRLNQNHVMITFIDLDGFKPINDTYGHDAGDKVLIEVTRRLTDSVRRTDTVARLGGDEFALIFPNIVDVAEIKKKISRILQEIANPVDIGRDTVSVTASMGTVIFPEDGDYPEMLCKRADELMYAAKKEKNQSLFSN